MSKEITLIKSREKRITNIYQHYSREQQRDFLSLLYFGEYPQDKKNIIYEIEKDIVYKIRNYKIQDIKKQRYIGNITYDNIIQKLVESKLLCYYCKKNIDICYMFRNQQNQWTLDRIDNDTSHTFDNCVISCLHCNISKGKRSHTNFKFSKQLQVIKDE